MHLLRLLRARNLARSNRPHRFVRDHDLGPVLRFGGDGFELRGDNLDRLVAFSLFQRLTAAQDDTQTSLERGLGFARYELLAPSIVSTFLLNSKTS